MPKLTPNGPITLPAASYGYTQLKTAIETALVAVDDTARFAQVLAAVEASKVVPDGTTPPIVVPPPVPAPMLSLSSALVKVEGNSGTTTFAWTLTLIRDGSTAAFPYSWDIKGSGNNPANAADFGGAFPTGFGTFAAGETIKIIPVLVIGDTSYEPDDTFTLTVNASGLNTVTSTGTISNDDYPPETPDGQMEAVISPAVTTLRATYDFTKVGTAYSIPVTSYNGNGVYWPNKARRLLVPNPKYPDLFVSYYTPDHGTGASGFMVALCNGDPTVLSNWRQYDDVKANTDWLSHLSNLPAGNPILVGQQSQLETICIIPYNGKWIFHGQMTSVPGGRNQATVRAITTDGFNFVIQNTPLLTPTEYTDGHTGYFTAGPNSFPGIIDPGTGVKALYAGWSLHGGQSRSTLALWATDNPETGTWRLVQVFGKTIGRNAIGGVGNWVSFAFINMDWGSIYQTRQGWAFLTEGAARGAGASARPGDIYEVLVADDGRTMIAKPQLVLARGGTGTIDNGEVSRGESFKFANKLGFIYEAADGSNAKVAAIATSPLRNPQNTWFDLLSPAIPTFVTKQANFLTASAIPAGFTAVTTGAPTVAFSASGAAVTMAAGEAYFLFENDGFDPTTTDYVDIFLDDFRTIAGPSTAARVPYIGFATSKTARGAMTDAFFLSNGEGTAGTMSYTALVAGGVTSRASDYVYGVGYLANTSQTSNGPKHKGIRWFPKLNEAYVLEEGAEGEPIKTSTVNYPALLDKTKRWYPFIGFVSAGTTSITEQIQKLIVRVADSGGVPAAPTMNISADVSQSEGNSGTTIFGYTVTRSTTSGAVTANWSVAGAGANPAVASDFAGGVIPSGTINFPDGSSSALISISVAGDTTIEPNEAFTLSFTPPSGYTSSRSSAAGTIVNDDTATVVASQMWNSADKGANYVLSEDNLVSTYNSGSGDQITRATTNGTGKFYFEVTAVNVGSAANLPIGVADTVVPVTTYLGGTTRSVGLVPGTGKVFYNAVASSTTYATFAAGDIIGIAVDRTVSPAVIYYSKNGVWLGSFNPAAGTGGFALPAMTDFYPAFSTNRIGASARLNTGPSTTYAPPSGYSPLVTSTLPSMNIGGDLSVSEGNSGTTNFTFTVTRSSTAGAVSAAWSVAGSGAYQATGADFVGGVLPSGTINFADGVATANIVVPVAGDTTNEQNEGFTVSITPPAGYTTTRSTSNNLILNDDAVTGSGVASYQSRYQASNAGNASTYSFTAVPLGTEGTTRKLRVVGTFRFAAATSASIAATFTPDGGSPITMSPIITRKSTYDSGESAIAAFTLDVPTGTQGTVQFTLPTAAVRAGLDSICTLNAGASPLTRTAEAVNSTGTTMSVTIDKYANAFLWGVGMTSTTGVTSHSAAMEVPLADASAVAITLTNNNSSTLAWTGIGNGDAGLVTEATGSGGGVLLVMEFFAI